MNAPTLISALLEEMIQENGTDLYLNVGIPPALRVGDRILPMRTTILTQTQVNIICEQLLDIEKQKEFHSTLEYNYSFAWDDRARFRASFFKQQQYTGIVIRRINTAIPTLEELGLPKVYGDLIMQKNGLILVVGKAGSGKSSSMAAMVGHRNKTGSGHVITLEDPIEFIHKPDRCIFTQRDVGIDTYSFASALKNALRQRPDVVVIGEIRDTEVMSQVLSMAESGHLCMATLHAGNAYQTIQRILDMFPEERHNQVLKSLSAQLRGVLCQRLVDTVDGEKGLAKEILLNEGAVGSLIMERKLQELKELMAKSRASGMVTFDQSLMDLLIEQKITEKTALNEADSPTDLALKIRQWRLDQQNGIPAANLQASLLNPGPAPKRSSSSDF